VFPIRSAVPYRYPPVVTWALILANCGVFFMQLGLRPAELEDLLFQLGVVPARYLALFSGTDDFTPADLLPFFTMMFLHGGWLHLILNMWFLWLFGPAIEDRLGHGRYLAFYLICGVIAAIAHIVTNPTSTEPAIGASGAIAGVLGCYMRLFPLARVIVLVPIIIIPLFFEIPAFVFVGFWFLIQILQGTVALALPSTGESVAWWAHVGGFVAGFLLGPPLRQPERQYRPYYADEGVLGFDSLGRRRSSHP
jgi:membrane associated rhomboid family serine protease